MQYKIEVLLYGDFISLEIRKGGLTIVFDGSCQTNLDDNIVAVAWVIHCAEIYIYA